MCSPRGVRGRYCIVKPALVDAIPTETDPRRNWLMIVLDAVAEIWFRLNLVANFNWSTCVSRKSTLGNMREHWRPSNEPPWYSFRRIPSSSAWIPPTAGKQPYNESINNLTSPVEGQDKEAGLVSLSRKLSRGFGSSRWRWLGAAHVFIAANNRTELCSRYQGLRTDLRMWRSYSMPRWNCVHAWWSVCNWRSYRAHATCANAFSLTTGFFGYRAILIVGSLAKRSNQFYGSCPIECVSDGQVMLRE